MVLGNKATTISTPNASSETLAPIAEVHSRHDNNIGILLSGSTQYDSGHERYGTMKVFIRQIVMVDRQQFPQQTFDYGDQVILAFLLEAGSDFRGMVRIGTRVKSVKEDFVLSISDLTSSLPLDLRRGQSVSVYYDFSLPLTHGHYSLLVALFEVKPISGLNTAAYDFSNSVIFDCIDHVCPFSIRPHVPISAVGPVHMDRKLQLWKSCS